MCELVDSKHILRHYWPALSAPPLHYWGTAITSYPPEDLAFCLKECHLYHRLRQAARVCYFDFAVVYTVGIRSSIAIISSIKVSCDGKIIETGETEV